jgi:hypothetical protein
MADLPPHSSDGRGVAEEARVGDEAMPVGADEARAEERGWQRGQGEEYREWAHSSVGSSRLWEAPGREFDSPSPLAHIWVLSVAHQNTGLMSGLVSRWLRYRCVWVGHEFKGFLDLREKIF